MFPCRGLGPGADVGVSAIDSILLPDLGHLLHSEVVILTESEASY